MAGRLIEESPDLSVKMAGIDYKNAEISVRERFSAGKEKSVSLMRAYMKENGVRGCVVVSTCNRTEVYVSAVKHDELDIADFLCGELGLDKRKYRVYFTRRNEREAFRHLCGVCAGITSQILGDDRIITQVREALELSRECGCTDSYIETVFRTAIKTAKEIKTKMTVCSGQKASAPYKALEKIKSLIELDGENAAVIGNGQMGRLSSELLLKENARLTVTLREYKKGGLKVPTGAATVGYKNRYEVLEKARVIISATTSPHYTLRYDEFAALSSSDRLIIDLAVPRDVEPKIGGLPGVSLFTIDDLGDGDNSLPKGKIEVCDKVIEENFLGYCRWREFKQRCCGLRD